MGDHLSYSKYHNGDVGGEGAVLWGHPKYISKNYRDQKCTNSEMLRIANDLQNNRQTDKIPLIMNPINSLRLCLWKQVFPNAKFIFSIRHPYDCVLSCFMQNFRLNDAMSNFLTLEDSAFLYDSVMRLWTQYKSIFSINSSIPKSVLFTGVITSDTGVKSKSSVISCTLFSFTFLIFDYKFTNI